MADRDHDFPARGVALVMIGSLISLGVSCAILWWLFPGANPEIIDRPEQFGAPRLEIFPVEQYEMWLAEQTSLLQGASGRMPIGEAMEATAARGAEAFAPWEPDR